MNKKFILGLVLALTINSVPASAYVISNTNKAQASAVSEVGMMKPAALYGFVYNKINVEEVKDQDAPQEIKTLVENNKKEKGFAYYAVDDNTGYIYIAVMAGEKSTGGYSIKVNSIEDCEGRTNVFVEETSPASGMITTQAITYPYTIVRAKGITPNITVKDSQGELFRDIINDKTKDIKPGNNVPIKGITVNKLKYNILTQEEISKLPLKVSETVEKLKSQNGFYVFDNEKYGLEQDGIYVMISLGERSTTGYSLDVVTAEDSEGASLLTVKENTPAPGTITGQMITCPYIIVKFTQGTRAVHVYNFQGEKLSALVLDGDASEIEDTNWKDITAPQASVNSNKEWTVKFNRAIAAVKPDSSMIYVRDSEGNLVATELTASKDMKSVIVKPVKNYQQGETYYLFVSQRINSNPRALTQNNGYRMKFAINGDITVE